jgi:hypothetical protein
VNSFETQEFVDSQVGDIITTNHFVDGSDRADSLPAEFSNQFDGKCDNHIVILTSFVKFNEFFVPFHGFVVPGEYQVWLSQDSSEFFNLFEGRRVSRYPKDMLHGRSP